MCWHRLALSLLAAFGGLAHAHAQFHVSQLRAVSSSGAQAGTTFDLTATVGDKLDECDKLFFSHPGITAALKTLDPAAFSEDRVPHFGHFNVTVAKEVPPGRYEVRVGGRHGVSNPRAFVVNSLVHQRPASVSHDSAAPTPLPLRESLHAKTTSADIDYFALSVSDGQSIKIELLAQRVDSRMIGQLKLHDSSGRMIAAARGGDNFDPVLIAEKLSSGNYLLAVHDFLFRGGAEFHYQVVSQEATSAIEFVDRIPDTPGQLPRDWLTRSCTVLGHEALAATNESNELQPIDAPSEITQWFSSDGSDTGFEFAADEGEQFSIDIVSQRQGQPTDARLIVQRVEAQQDGPPKLHDMLNVDDSQAVGDAAVHLGSKDPVALFKAPATSSYRVTVRDLDDGQMLSLRQQYQLRIQQPNPGFDLVAYRVYPHRDANQSRAFASKLFRGSAEAIRVLAIRRDGWTGPIKLTAENLPAGVSCNDATIATNQVQTQMTLIAAEDAGRVTGAFRVIGHSEDDKIKRDAIPATLVWGRGGGREFIRSRITSSLYVSVSDQDLSPLSITLGDATTAEVKQGQPLSLPIKLTRRDGSKAQCVLRPRDFPSGVTAGEVTIPADKNEGKLDLKVAAGAAVGTYSLWLQVETKIKVKPNPQALVRAQQYRTHLQTLHDDPTQAANLESIKSAIATADKKVEAAKAAAKEQELTVFIPTSHATLRVVQP